MFNYDSKPVLEDCLDVKVYLKNSRYIDAHDRRPNKKGLCWENVPGRTIFSFSTTQKCGKWLGMWYTPTVVVEVIGRDWKMPSEMTVRDLVLLSRLEGLYKCRVYANRTGCICPSFLFSEELGVKLFKWRHG